MMTCFNVVKKCLRILHKLVLYIFNLSLQTGNFPDKLKISRLHNCLKAAKTMN